MGTSDVPNSQGDQARVLLVDDNPTNLQVLYQTLDGQGYRLLVAKSGEDALRIAQSAHPELILLDIMMPGIDGYETCRRLKADPQTQEAAVIFLSALDQTEKKVEGLELGAVDYVTKPFEAAEVIARVNTHLTIHRLQRALAARNAALEEANRRMKDDLDAAARVQRTLLPSELPSDARAGFAWFYRPCDELAGDVLGVFGLDDDHVSMFVLDSSGHGVPAALLAVSAVRRLIPRENNAERLHEPAALAAELNDAFPMEQNGGHYFTLLYGVLDRNTRQFRYTSAGHPGPVVVRESGVEALSLPGVPAGMMAGIQYDEQTVQLEPGDRLYIYSDGLVEEMNDDMEEFGLDRVREALGGVRAEGLRESIDAVMRRLWAYHGEEHLKDDVSIVATEVS